MLTKETFNSYVEQGYNRIPVYKEILADTETPVSAYLKLANEKNGYLLESVQGGEKWGRFSFIGLPASTHIESKDNHVKVIHDNEVIEEHDGIAALDFVQTFSERYHVPDIDDLPIFSGGLVGYLGYPVIHEIEPKMKRNEATEALFDVPDIYLTLSEKIVAFDNLNGRITLISYVDPSYQSYEDGLQDLVNIEQQIMSKNAHQELKKAAKPAAFNGEISYHFDKDTYFKAIDKCHQYIKNGDIFQVVPSQIMSMDFELPAVQLYRALRTLNPSPYMYYLNLGDFDVVGCSPEALVRLEDKEVTVRPIAGTRHRGKTEDEDVALEKDLLSDKKELAEHLMLIDLGRNDVGRVAQGGSVNVNDYMVIERYSHVMHIVSNVSGQIKDNMNAMDVFKATFPAGTLSGAPKIRALEIVEELEPVQRSIYSGAVGYLGWNGNMDLAIAIRTAIVKDNKLYVQAGGGVVADSVAENEWQETINKSKAIIKGAEMAYQYFTEK